MQRKWKCSAAEPGQASTRSTRPPSAAKHAAINGPPKPQPPAVHGDYGDAERKASYQDELARWQGSLVDHHRQLSELRQWVIEKGHTRF